MLLVSVILCTHNPREDYLRRALDALKAQTLPKDQWELLLVDNASRDPLAGKWDLSWHPNGRHLQENKTGLTHARLCGIAAAQGALLVFVDDDNVLRLDYLETALKICATYPWLGAWGGSYIPEFEVEPPAELRPWLGGLVIDRIAVPIWAKLARGTEACPSGAGMVVSSKVAASYRELVLHDPVRQALDRSGEKLGGGGDSDMALCGFNLDLGAGRFPELELTHLIPKQRLNLDYLEGIHEGFGYAKIVVNALHGEKQRRGGEIFSCLVRLWLLNVFLLARRKSKIERRIRLAEEKGKLRGFITLKQMF